MTAAKWIIQSNIYTLYYLSKSATVLSWMFLETILRSTRPFASDRHWKMSSFFWIYTLHQAAPYSNTTDQKPSAAVSCMCQFREPKWFLEMTIHNYRGTCDDQKFVKGESKIKYTPHPHPCLMVTSLRCALSRPPIAGESQSHHPAWPNNTSTPEINYLM